MAKDRPAKPVKPWPQFPLTPTAKGWVKKVNGRVRHFGPPGDPMGALAKWEREAPRLRAGKEPPPDPAAVTVQHVVNRFLADKEKDADSGAITGRHFTAMRRNLLKFTKAVGGDAAVADLTPDDFTRALDALGRKVNTPAADAYVQHVRTMFRHAVESEWCQPVRFGRRFRKRPAAAARKARKVREFTPAQVRLILAEASRFPQWRAMVLLGLNGAFGQTDIARLTCGAVDLGLNVIQFPRPKTGVDRTVPLWPETADALRPLVAGKGPGELVFTTRTGRPWVREYRKLNKAGELVRVTRTDAVSSVFYLLVKAVNAKGGGLPGHQFYTLKRTVATIADEMGDGRALAALLGHIRKTDDVTGIYIQRITHERLRRLVDHVRERLLGHAAPPMPNKTP